MSNQATEARRYRFLRAKAMRGSLEAFVALGQADFIPTPERFDAWVDEEMKTLEEHPNGK